ncbi:MAG: hypothetical protein ORN26_00875 [Candidatus Pacebacteria bacterium]|nr:hypothetical protein [Candidatus Paceibacterota bacterium]
MKRNASTTADIELKEMINLIKKNNKTPTIQKSKNIQVIKSTSTAI